MTALRSMIRQSGGDSRMRSRVKWVALLAAAMIAVPASHAQQPPEEPSPPERFINELGGAIRGLFESIFGRKEPEAAPKQAPAEPAAPQPQAAPVPLPAAGKPAQEAGAPQPVVATPSASPTPTLHSAIAKGDYATAMKLIEQGTDVEAKDPGAGASPLHYAVMKGALPMVGLLLQRGADVNSRTRSGTTPLHTAVVYNLYETAEYLLDKGAEVNAKSASGATPLALARAAKYRHIEKLLRDRGAN